MALLQVAILRRDPNCRHMLEVLRSTKSISPRVLKQLSEHAISCGHYEASRLALDFTLERLLEEKDKDFDSIATVLHDLSYAAANRSAAKPHFDLLRALLTDCEAASCTVDTDTLQWFLATSWNHAVAAFQKQRPAEAEQWITLANFFSRLSPALNFFRGKMQDLLFKNA